MVRELVIPVGAHNIVNLENQWVNFYDYFNESINRNMDFIVLASETPEDTKCIFNYNFNSLRYQHGGSHDFRIFRLNCQGLDTTFDF